MPAGDTTTLRPIDPDGEIIIEPAEIDAPRFEYHSGSETERDTRFNRRVVSGFENPTMRPTRVEPLRIVPQDGVTP